MKKEFKVQFKKLYKNPPAKLLESFKAKSKVDLVYNELFPCFYTGNLDLVNPIITISLNPLIDREEVQVKKKEQGDDFEKWLEGCMNGFSAYQNDTSLHDVWKYLYRVFKEVREVENERKEFLQNNVINLDWCYYYSSKFPTLGKRELKKSERKELYKLFDDNLTFLINELKPRVIFIHGKSLNEWFENNVTDIKNELTLIHKKPVNGVEPSKSLTRKNWYEIKSGYYGAQKIPVVYQEWFIGSGNLLSNLDKVRELVESKMN